ncbi:MAG: hypothetical protein EBR88_01330, partial [Betaproteobacteria bacterium]|nr:hypothetical protein [Betaproteobacteria bacterium]
MWTAVGVLAALVMLGASAGMNWVFLTSHGETELERQILGGVSVAVDVLKAALPFYLAWAWVGRRWLYVGLGSLVLVVFLVFSLAS